MNCEFIVGALYRRKLRRYLLSNNYSFIEDKGFLDSQFMIDCNEEQYKVLEQWALLNHPS